LHLDLPSTILRKTGEALMKTRPVTIIIALAFLASCDEAAAPTDTGGEWPDIVEVVFDGDDDTTGDVPDDSIVETGPDPVSEIPDTISTDPHGCWATYECTAECGDDTDCNLACISSMCEPSRTPYNALSGCRNMSCSAHCLADMLADQCLTCQETHCPEEIALCRTTGCD
jgi:hypothetical protein